MKRIIIIIVTAVFAMVIGLSIWLVTRDSMVVRNPVILHENAMITYALGDCFYKTSQEEEWLPLVIGLEVKVGYLLKTMDNGEVDIRFSQNTVMRMDYNTTLQISENTLKDLSVDMEQGTLYAKFHKLFDDQQFQVRTQESVAGIRGTELVFQAREGQTEIFALSGITEVYNPRYENQRILLAFQTKSTLSSFEPPTQPESMTHQEIQNFQQIVNTIHSEKVFLISNSIQFAPNSAEILSSSFGELEEVVQALKGKRINVEIAGHTAHVGSPTAMYELSVARAQAIMDYLVEQGIREKRLSVQGYGSSLPVAGNDTAEGRALNRRVEFVILD